MYKYNEKSLSTEIDDVAINEANSILTTLPIDFLYDLIDTIAD